MEINIVTDFVYRWQDFLGAIIGASVPILFWFFVKFIEVRRQRKEDLLYLQKNIIYNINIISDIHDTLKKFIDDQFAKLIINIDDRIQKDKYSADRAYFPLFSLCLIDDSLLSRHSGSGYVDNKILQVHKITKELSMGIIDLRHQFNDTISINMNMAFSKMNPPIFHNNQFKDNLNEFKDMVDRDIFTQNIPTSIKVLAETLVAIECINRIGLFRWKYKFSGSFKYFRKHSDFKGFKNNTYERISAFLKGDLDKKIEEIQQKLYNQSMTEKKITTIETYNKNAKALADKFDSIGPRISDIEEVLKSVHKENPFVLEIGCGNGRDAKEILRRTNQYLGMDISDELIRLAKEKNPEGVFIVADIEDYSFPNNLDAIIAFASFIHIPKDSFRRVLEKAFDALNPGGIFRISLKHADKYSEITNEDKFGTRTYYHYSEDDVMECAHGYDIQKIELNYITSQETMWLEVLLQKPTLH